MLNKDQIERQLLFHYLPELESCQIRNGIDPIDQLSAEHIKLLVDYLKQTYGDTTRHLESLLQGGEITYDLLWTLFKPNDLVHTTCSGTRKPRCVRFDFGEEKETSSGSKYWNVECRYLHFDGANLGESSIELKISKFRGVKRINTLEAFPLQHHPEADCVKAELLRCGKKFVNLRGTHHRHCRGTAFIILKEEQVKISVDSRIMIDAVFFRRMNPNYLRQRITKNANAAPIHFSDSLPTLRNRPRTEVMAPTDLTDDDLLICSPTVLGFSFNDTLWGKMLPRQ